MKKILRLLILVAFIFGIAIAFAPFVIPDLARQLDPLICPNPDAMVDIIQTSASGGGIRMSFECVDAEGIRSDASILAYIVLFSAWFWLPLLPMILLIIWERISRMNKAHQFPDLPSSI